MRKVFWTLIFLFFPTLVFAQSINLNTASLAQLKELTGIGPTYAQRIIDARPYASVDDLDRVKGIGAATLQKIKDQGLACVACETPTNPAPENVKTDIQTTPSPNDAGIIFHRILPNPSGSDETDEWIELKNTTSIDTNLSGWQIQDTAGTQTTFTLAPTTHITANGILVFKRPETKILLNNNGDGLMLLTPSGQIIDSVHFTNAPLGAIYAKNGNDWKWQTPPTSTGPATIAKHLPKSTKPAKNIAVASLIDSTSPNETITSPENALNNNPWILFFIALAITIIAGIITLLTKLKLFKHHERSLPF